VLQLEKNEIKYDWKLAQGRHIAQVMQLGRYHAKFSLILDCAIPNKYLVTMFQE